MEMSFGSKRATPPDFTTRVEIQGSRAIFEVRTRSPIYRDSLLHMGFALAEDTLFTRNLSNWGDLPAIHRYFSQHLEEMVLQSARLQPANWQDTLDLFLRRVEGTPLQWFLYGSAALALRGIEIQPGDLDLWVSDAYLTGSIFEDLLVEPMTVMTGWVADHGGRAFAGCIFEWIADVHPEVDDPSPHEQGPTALSSLESVCWRGWTIPVAPLALQLSVAERRGLADRVERIRNHMSNKQIS